MGDGWKRAVLATLQTRSWTVEGKPLTGAQVSALYHALALQPLYSVEQIIGGVRGSRRWDRAIQILKSAGLVQFDRKHGWRQT